MSVPPHPPNCESLQVGKIDGFLRNLKHVTRVLLRDAFQKWEYLMVGCVQLAAWQVYADRVSILVTEETSLGGSWSIISKGKVFFSFDQFRHFLISLSLSLSVRPSYRHHHHGQGCGCILAGNKASALQPLDKVSPTKNMLCFFSDQFWGKINWHPHNSALT